MNNFKLLLVLSILVLFGIVSCSSSKKESNGDYSNSNGIPKETQMEKIPPGVCRIEGTVVSIEPVEKTSNTNDPCSKQPCWAKIKVKKVIGEGAGAPTLSAGNTIELKFAFTLGPTTKELFPNLDKRFPGLKAGDNFKGDVSNLRSIQEKNTQINEYKIFGYEKI